MKNELTRAISLDLLVIFSVWLLLLIGFSCLGLMGQATGLGVATLGEDMNWVVLLRQDSWRDIATSFWAIDSRNPLSPWSYIAAKSLILNLPYGLALLQHFVGFLLAVSSYFLLLLICDGKNRLFALATASIIAINISNAYFDHIIWNFQFALVCSIASIVCYLLYLKTNNGAGAYGLSLGFWCLAVHIYTLQSGALFAIALCALRPCLGAGINLQARLRQFLLAVVELSPFGLIFIIFILTWTTTSTSSGSPLFLFSAARLLSSFSVGVFHPDSYLMFQILELSKHQEIYVLAACLFSLSAGFTVHLVCRNQEDARSCSALLAILVVLSIALPTIVLESGGTDWPPGSRWRMIYQFTSPVLWMSSSLLISNYFRKFRQLIQTIIFVSLFAWSVTASLVYNERQVLISRSESTVRATIEASLLNKEGPNVSDPVLALVVIDDTFRWLATESLWPVYMKAWFPNGKVIFELLPSQSYILASASTKVAFREDGVRIDGRTNSVLTPYSRVVVVRASGQTASRELTISQREVMEHNGEWQMSRDQLTLN